MFGLSARIALSSGKLLPSLVTLLSHWCTMVGLYSSFRSRHQATANRLELGSLVIVWGLDGESR